MLSISSRSAKLALAVVLILHLLEVTDGLPLSLPAEPLSAADLSLADTLTNEELYGNTATQRRPSLLGDVRSNDVARTKGSNIRRNGVASTLYKWPQGIIPYTIDRDFSNRERAVIARAMARIAAVTCIRFVPYIRGQHPDYVNIKKADGCWSSVGRDGGRQEMSLGIGCVDYPTVIHELIHAIGFFHEQERTDRDQYITIQWQNMDYSTREDFSVQPQTEISYYGQPYDYFSIMHYARDEGSNNGRDVIKTTNAAYQHLIGEARDMSRIDIAEINTMYNCGGGGQVSNSFQQAPAQRATQNFGVNGFQQFYATTPAPVFFNSNTNVNNNNFNNNFYNPYRPTAWQTQFARG